MNKQYLFIASIFAFFFSLLVIGCEDKIQEWELIPHISHIETGFIVTMDDDSVADTLHTSTVFEDGMTLSIAAIVSKLGWEFDRWEGDLTGTDNPATIIVDGDKSVIAVFKLLQYPLSISKIGDGYVTEEIILGKTADYGHGSNIRLTATPDTGWEFDRWEGDLTGTDNPATIIVDSDKSITAVFKLLQYPLSISKIGDGYVTEEIILGKTADYGHGSNIRLTATPDTGWEFDRWEGDLTSIDNPATIIVDGDKSVTAVFVQIPFIVNLMITGDGSVNKNPEQDAYFYNEVVGLTAAPSTGWKFDHWEGDLTGTDNPATIIVDGDKSVTAVFVQIPFIVNLMITGDGSVNKNPEQDTYFYNEAVGLTATPSTGWEFDHWEGDLTGTDNPATVIMDGDKSVIAVYVKSQYNTENVIIVVVDGPRYSETWGDPNHQYIPRLANQMSSYGVINTQFYNNGITWTNPGHTSITTGVYQEVDNSGHEIPKYPSIFQYWNKKYSTNDDMSWIITSKDKLEILGDCLQNDWNGKYLPSVNCGINGNGSGYRDDSVTFNKVIDVLSNNHPQMVLVNFREPDYSGHSGNWGNYLQGIKSSDEYVYQIWNYINNDSYYKGKTTMFVTNDHGRHLDGVAGGFVSHGDNCEGCKHINLYSFGPDFKKGLITNVKRELIDISSTIAELLQFDQNYGNGKIMYELFK